MKPLRLVLALVTLAVLAFAADSQDDLLKIEASVQPRRLSPGQEGIVLLKLSVRDGITISPHPDFIVELRPCDELVFPKNFFTASDLEVEVVEKDSQECLGFEKPLKIPVTVSPKARRGSFILEGRIKYYARSASQGWCVKNSAKFFAAYSLQAAPAKSPA